MDQATIITLTILAVLILAMLVGGGLVLSARSFTQLVELLRWIGSLLDPRVPDPPLPPTISSTETEPSTSSAPTDNTPTTLE